MAVKKQKLFLMTFFLCILSGCGRTSAAENAPALCRVVDRIDISSYHEGTLEQFSYSTPQKMETILFYLRQLDYQGKAHTDPERICGDSYHITVMSSDGTVRNYRQRANRYLSRDHHPWECIDPNRAEILYSLLQSMPSDVP